jgi:RNA polymerase sigma factor (sigma-70 family)
VLSNPFKSSPSHEELTRAEFDALFRQYYKTIRNFIYFRCGDRDMAEDIAQDTFVKLWEVRDRVDRKTVKSYLYTIAQNTTINQQKRQQLMYKFQKRTTSHLDSDTPEKLAFRQIFLDTAQLAKIVAGFPEVDPDRLGAAGGSQGGALCIACAALAPEIKRLAPIHPFLSDYLRVWQMDLAVNAYEELKYYFRIIDPLHEREQEVFTKLGYIDVQYLAPRIQGKVMMAITLMDTICPPSTQFAVFNKIQSPKEAVIYHDYAHERLPRFQDKTFEFLTQL